MSLDKGEPDSSSVNKLRSNLVFAISASKIPSIRALPPALGTSLRQPSPLPEGGNIGGQLIRFQVDR